MNKNNEEILRKEIYYIIKVNHLVEYIDVIEDLIDQQGIETVFKKLYDIYQSNGDIVRRKKRLIDIIHGQNK